MHLIIIAGTVPVLYLVLHSKMARTGKESILYIQASHHRGGGLAAVRLELAGPAATAPLCITRQASLPSHTITYPQTHAPVRPVHPSTARTHTHATSMTGRHTCMQRTRPTLTSYRQHNRIIHAHPWLSRALWTRYDSPHPNMPTLAPTAPFAGSPRTVIPALPARRQVANSSNLSRTVVRLKLKNCHLCPMAFLHKVSLRKHIRTHTGEQPHNCHVCSRAFSQKSNLTVHLRLHTGERPHSCHFCPKKFSQKNSLANHIRTHTGERPFKCSFCTLAFSVKGNLVTHIRTHDADRPYTCHLCIKSYDDKRKLTRHLRPTHGGEQPFKCQLCTMGFSAAGKLADHLRIHGGKQETKCTFCEKTFIHASKLKDHLRTHTGERPYSCPVCSSALSTQGSLNKHLRTLHAVIQEKFED